jgi:hypothetical protein
MLIDPQCNCLPKKLRPMCKWKKYDTMSSKKQKPTKLGNYKTFRTCKQKCYGYGSIEGVFFFLRNGKLYCKKKHHTQKAKGLEGDKPKPTKSLN